MTRAFWCARVFARAFHSSYARHEQSLGGESPLGETVVLTPSRRQRRHCEVGSGGSRRRNPAPRNTNRIRGATMWMSWQRTAKSATTKTSFRRCGGGRGKAAVLIRGDLSRRRVRVMFQPSPHDRRRSDAAVDPAEVSRGHSSDAHRHEGPNVKPRAIESFSCGRAERSQLTVGEPYERKKR